MIIGTGLVARALADFGLASSGRHLFLASGVSNSSASVQSQFNREKQVVGEAISAQSWRSPIYFSSVEIVGDGWIPSAYRKHKLMMEQFVLDQGGRVLRLPLIHGRGGSRHTLLNHFYDLIRQNSVVEVQAEASRNVIDAVDLGPIVDWATSSDKEDQPILSITSYSDFHVAEIVQALIDYSGSNARIALIEGASRYVNHRDSLGGLYDRIPALRDESYAEKIALKYFYRESYI